MNGQYQIVIKVIWTQNNRGKQIIVVNGYSFYPQKQQKHTIRWACTAGTTKCKTNVFTSQREVIRAKLDHSHQPNNYLDSEQPWQRDDHSQRVYVLPPHTTKE
ncbi:hypothetical protein MSG28_008201 [Choristoneura fumiferana]|uniref:Uncharacterized protein n=1 Tax=Choristoneura fumiferana TaxID=7141 RepID=A0ACC0JAI8_CHOFU|nr:hypothetical protein MSG28_008201 [Choristoneura fumiferana]